MMTIVTLYTDQPVLALGLEYLLSGSDFALGEVAASMTGLKEIAATQRPEIALLDLTSEVTFGALSDMKRALANTKVLLWAHDISTELAFQVMGLGVRGILRKQLPTEMIIKCLQKVQAGELWFEKGLTDAFLQAKRIALTQREGQLAILLSQGLKNKEIATALLISEGTVKVYLSRLFAKCGVKDRYELALYALKNLTTGLGDLKGTRSDYPPRAAALPLPGLRSLVLERGPEFVPKVRGETRIRKMPIIPTRAAAC